MNSMNHQYSSDVVIESSISLSRNIKKYSFPNKISRTSAELLVDEVKNIINESVTCNGMKYVNLENCTFIEKLALMESRIISKELVKKIFPAGIILDENNMISIMVNEQDHIKIQSIAHGMQMDKAWIKADEIDNIIEEKIDYAFDDQYGYVTSCPTKVGTGLTASYMIHVPALEAYGQLQFILQAIGKFGVTVRGIYGEGSEAEGSIFQISNQITLGQSEDEIIQNISNVTNQIVDQERRVRKKLMSDKKLQLEDKVYRSYGTLLNARIITLKEALTLLSDIKLGIELGILDTINDDINIYKLMADIQTANLQKIIGIEITQQNINIERARYIRDNIPRIK